MATKDLEREKEIDTCEDLLALKRIRGTRKGQLTKVQQDLERYSCTPLADLKRITLEGLTNNFEKQARFCTRAQDRILTLIQARSDSGAYDEEEKESDTQESLHQTIRDKIQELLAALDAANKAKRLMDLFQSSDSLGDRDVLAKLESMETTINELLDIEASISEFPELSTQLSDLQLLHRWLTKEVLRTTTPPSDLVGPVTTTSTPTLRGSVRLPRMELPTFDGEQEKWRDFWDEFRNALEKDTGLTSTDKLHYLRNSIKSEEGKDIVATGSRGGRVMEHLCSSLHIDKLKTTPYHPEGNGVCERMHGTLGAMLTKAAKVGQDWVGQVPFALFALRRHRPDPEEPVRPSMGDMPHHGAEVAPVPHGPITRRSGEVPVHPS